jgi:hypothetical protein
MSVAMACLIMMFDSPTGASLLDESDPAKDRPLPGRVTMCETKGLPPTADT